MELWRNEVRSVSLGEEVHWWRCSYYLVFGTVVFVEEFSHLVEQGKYLVSFPCAHIDYLETFRFFG